MICKDIHYVGIPFEILDLNHHVTLGWKKVTGHMVFVVKMYFLRRAHWELDGDRNPDP